MQQVRGRPGLARALMRELQAFMHQSALRIAQRIGALREPFELEFERCERLPGRVVQVAADAAALLILQSNQRSGELVQLAQGTLALAVCVLTLGDIVHDGERERLAAGLQARQINLRRKRLIGVEPLVHPLEAVRAACNILQW